MSDKGDESSLSLLETPAATLPPHLFRRMCWRLVPVLSATLPFFAAALLPLIAILVAFANWLSEAGKRGAASAITVLRQWSRTGEESA